MKTLEFKLYPSKEQERRLLSWLELTRKVWNYGLYLLKEVDKFSHYDKISKNRFPCCPIPWEYRYSKPDDVSTAPKGESWLKHPYSKIKIGRSKYPSCPIPEHHRSPVLKDDSFFSLVKFFAKKNHKNWSELQDCPNNFIRSTLKHLSVAWLESKTGKKSSSGKVRKEPKFKPKNFLPSSLSDLDCKRNVKAGGKTIKLPMLGTVRIRGNNHNDRWPSEREILTFTVKKEPSGWYLLMVGEIPTKGVRDSYLKVGIDAGVVHTLTTSNGKHINGPSPLNKNLSKLKKLQQKMARQKKGGSNWNKTLNKFKKVHELNRRCRKSFSHKISTFLLRTYGGIAIEDLKISSLVKSNSSKSILNRNLMDVGLGQLFYILETKGRVHNRCVKKVNPAYTSQKCSVCNHTDSGNRISQERFKCLKCGNEMNADHNAAINILNNAWPSQVILKD